MNKIKIVEEFPKRFDEALIASGKTCRKIADKAGVSYASITQYRYGDRMPTSGALMLLAEALDVNELWLLGYDVCKTRMNIFN